MSEQVVLMVGHGSRVPEAIAEFHRFADAFAERLSRPVQRCFLELEDPDMATGLADAARSVGAGGEVLVLPLFLGAAAHQKNDVPASIQWARGQFPGAIFRYGTPLGCHAKLVTLLDQRVRECLESNRGALVPEETAVLVVGRGSSDPSSNGDIAKTAHMLFEKRAYLTVEYAFQAVACPTVGEGMRRCCALGAKQIVVAPFVLFTGKVVEDIRRVSAHAGAELGVPVLQADYLRMDALLLDVAEQRLQEAAAGNAAMNCDQCKYRLPMAGYEHQVGLVQITHHLYGGAQHEHTHEHEHAHHVFTHHDHDASCCGSGHGCGCHHRCED